ncbi:MAG TPA: hypothetical protein VGH27_29940 [Streptosporangiaceae bacterium]|jgi:hypothetical protein
MAAPTPGLIGSFQLSPQQEKYQLSLGQGDTTTTWDFTSADPTTDQPPAGTSCFEYSLGVSDAPCQAQPLIFLRYNSGVDLANAWTAPGSHQLQITAYHLAADAPAITSLKVWTSVNGGATWTKAALASGTGGVYTTTISVPELSKTSGTVSIRAQATDAQGNRVSQTIYKAWSLAAG